MCKFFERLCSKGAKGDTVKYKPLKQKKEAVTGGKNVDTGPAKPLFHGRFNEDRVGHGLGEQWQKQYETADTLTTRTMVNP